MRKIIALIMICFFSLVIKSEKAISKTNCKMCCNSSIKKTSLSAESNNENEPIQYDGFFFKI